MLPLCSKMHTFHAAWPVDLTNLQEMHGLVDQVVEAYHKRPASHVTTFSSGSSFAERYKNDDSVQSSHNAHVSPRDEALPHSLGMTNNLEDNPSVRKSIAAYHTHNHTFLGKALVNIDVVNGVPGAGPLVVPLLIRCVFPVNNYSLWEEIFCACNSCMELPASPCTVPVLHDEHRQWYIAET